jgi:sulfite exporter TauE/SafE
VNGILTPAAALALGLVASGHCALMCGGITAALGLASARAASGRPLFRLLLGYQLGRIASYTLAGLLLAGALGGVVAWLDVGLVRRLLRAFAALVLIGAALVAFGVLRQRGPGPARRLWGWVSPLGRRLLPVTSVPRALAFGAIWGWMPCGFVYSVLLIAALEMDAARGALTMVAFGVGTAPAMLLGSYGASRIAGLASRPFARRLTGAVLLLCALVTLAGPWWMPGGADAHAGHHGGHLTSSRTPASGASKARLRLHEQLHAVDRVVAVEREREVDVDHVAE